MCRSCFDKYKTMSRMRDELLEKSFEALAIDQALAGWLRATRGLTTITIDFFSTFLKPSNTNGRE